MLDEPKRVKNLADALKEEAQKMNQSIDMDSSDLKKSL